MEKVDTFRIAAVALEKLLGGQMKTDNKSSIRLVSPLGLGTGSILFFTLSVGLVLPNVAGAGMVLLGLIAIIWLTIHGKWTASDLCNSERAALVSIPVYVGMIVFSWLWHEMDPATGQALGRHARLLLIVPIFLYLRRINELEPVWWYSLYLGGLIVGGYAWCFVLTGQIGDFGVRPGGATSPIYFGGIALLVAFMLLPRIGDRKRPGWERILAGFAIAGGISASLLSGSRGAWLAAIPLVFLFLIFFWHNFEKSDLRRVIALFVILSIGLALLPTVNMHQRVLLMMEEVSAFMNGQSIEGGVSERLEMWRISMIAVKGDFWLGPGAGSFRSAVQLAVTDGVAHPALLNYRHPHNQFLSAFLYAGILGLITLLLLFILPLRRLWLLRRVCGSESNHKAWAGIAAISMLGVIALSESVFERNAGVVWFALLVSITLSLVSSDQKQ